MRQVRIYIVVATIASAAWVGCGIYLQLFSFSPPTVYCDENLPTEAMNFAVRGTPCRLKLGLIASIYGPIFLLLLAFASFPLCLFLAIRHHVRSIMADAASVASAQVKTPGGSRSWSVSAAVVYLHVSTLSVAAWLALPVWIMIDHNAGATYCSYLKDDPVRPTFYSQSEPCLINVLELLDTFGAFFLLATAAVQSPAYLYLMGRLAYRRYRARDRRVNETDVRT